MLFYAWLKVLQPAFYAIDKRWLPMMVSFFALGLNLGFNYFFVFVMRWGHESLALTTSITASVNFIILFLAMRKFAGDLGTVELLVLFGKLLFAGAVMGGQACMWGEGINSANADAYIWRGAAAAPKETSCARTGSTG